MTPNPSIERTSSGRLIRGCYGVCSLEQPRCQPFGQPDAPVHAFNSASASAARRLPSTLAVSSRRSDTLAHAPERRACTRRADQGSRLLAFAKSSGRSFQSHRVCSLGYTQENWERLRDDLLAIARSGTASAIPPGEFGQKFEVGGILVGPSGRSGEFSTVWLVRTGEDFPRFVTAFPR